MVPVIANFLAGIGMGELVIILLIVLVIFGAGKLPQIGDALGKGIRNFKGAVSAKDEPKPEVPVAPAPPAPAEKKDA
jgi:sec-independent protein translocase protein TatA